MKTYTTALVTVVSALAILAPLKAGAAAPPPGGGRYAPPPRYHAPARPAPGYHRTPVYNVAPVNGAGSATDAIAQAAARWGVDYGWLLRVASCESGLNPGAQNPSGASGLFQFMPGTYWLYASRIGETRSYWDAYGSANVAAYMFSIGLSYQWTCR